MGNDGCSTSGRVLYGRRQLQLRNSCLYSLHAQSRGPLWVGSLVVIHCDNQAAVSVVNSGYSKDSGHDALDALPVLRPSLLGV